MSNVSNIHPEYAAYRNTWKLTRDAAAGQVAIKRGGELYLPGFVPKDPERYEQYISRAYYMNMTGRTKNSMVGMIFRKPPTEKLPSQIKALLENIDGAGQSLEQLAKEAANNVLESGRHVFLVDYPQAEGGLSREDEARLDLRPTIASYPAESLINWRFEGVKGRQQLTLAVLAESVDKQDMDEFSHDQETKYRVLRLRDGVYTQQLYDDSGEPETEEYVPRMAGGAPFDHIPLHIAGAEDNKPSVDMPPLYDMAVLNIAHYQTTADHRENLFIHGQLTLGISTEMDYATFKEANPDGVQVGARRGHYLGFGGSFQSVTAPESSSLSKALTDIESQIVALGASLVQRGGQAETAEAARINASAESSVLNVMTNNLSEALEAALEDVARFIGVNPDSIEFKLNTEFWETGLDPAALGAIVQGYNQGLYGAIDALYMIRTGRVQLREEVTDEQIQEEVAGSLIEEPAEPVIDDARGAE